MILFQRKAKRAVLFFVCAFLLMLNSFGVVSGVSVRASAYYCDDGLFEGSGTQVSANYTIEFDYYVEHNEYRVECAPSLNNGGTGATNDCTATAGTNVIAFYDRYCPNLIPNHEPGVEVAGIYRYFPNMGSTAIETLHTTLYNYMGVNSVAPGASKDDFKSGLERYVTEQGYSISYSSIYESTKTVNLTQIKQMVNRKQVAVLFFMGYHFIYGFDTTETSRTVYRGISEAGHAMMIYGYFTVDYYKNNQKILTETYLEASSCNSFADKGYIKFNDYGTIDDAIRISIS